MEVDDSNAILDMGAFDGMDDDEIMERSEAIVCLIHLF